jgi:hypothetical protein
MPNTLRNVPERLLAAFQIGQNDHIGDFRH